MTRSVLKTFCITIVMLLILSSSASAFFGARFEPPDGMIYHGCGWDGFGSQANYHGMFPAAHHPLILQSMADMPGTRGITVARLIQALTGPLVHPDSQYIEYGLHFRGTGDMLDSVFALTTSMDNYIDTLAAAFQAVNRPFFLRIGFEFNGDWNPYHPYIFPLAFRKLVTELHARGVNNFASVWCYEPDAPADFADSTSRGWKWYPGDDIVDWFGLDPFDADHFNPALPDSFRGQLTKKGRTEAFLRFAELRRKPVYLNELSARGVNVVPDSLDSTHAEGQADWNSWFAPFFQFVNHHPIIKGWNYINLDWTHYDTYRSWGDARLEINSYIRQHWVDSLLAPRFLNVGYDIEQPGSVPRVHHPLPQAVALDGFPNPFNSTATIRLEIAQPARTAIIVFDLLGRQIAVLYDGVLPAGVHRFRFNGADLASGTYFVQAHSGSFTQRIKLLYLR